MYGKIEFKKEMPYREGADLGLAKESRRCIRQIKIEKGNAIWVNDLP